LRPGVPVPPSAPAPMRTLRAIPRESTSAGRASQIFGTSSDLAGDERSSAEGQPMGNVVPESPTATGRQERDAAPESRAAVGLPETARVMEPTLRANATR